MLRRIARTAALALALGTATAACGDDDAAAPDSSASETVYSDPATAVYAPALAIDLASMTRTSTGLYVRDRVVGTDTTTARPTSTVTVTYAGYVPTGRQFDAGTARFALTQVVKGFQEGITGMRVGGERTLVIPPALGYGPAAQRDQAGRVVIPANSVLVFTVKLVSIP